MLGHPKSHLDYLLCFPGPISLQQVSASSELPAYMAVPLCSFQNRSDLYFSSSYLSSFRSKSAILTMTHETLYNLHSAASCCITCPHRQATLQNCHFPEHFPHISTFAPAIASARNECLFLLFSCRVYPTLHLRSSDSVKP